ncbi:MAG: hypothetical protein VB111_12355 [Clostridiaceae bacterium]|nr:hypothetical protein [Clostridiaceae bacterium]
MLHTIGSSRILMMDSSILYRTNAATRLHEPRREEIVYTFDSPGDGNGTGSYLTLLYDAGRYLLYYLNWDMYTKQPRTVGVLTSADGLHWEKPALSGGSNVVFDPAVYGQGLDNFIPFIDRNPTARPEERFKAFSGLARNDLRAYASPDGFTWTPLFDNRPLAMPGAFDSSNLAFYDTVRSRYCAFIRDFHDIPGDDLNHGIRDIRVSYSEDFEHWTEPIPLDFGNAPDIPLYVSAAQPYFNAPEYFVGFPVRYVERPAWSPAFDQLSGPAHRRYRMSLHPRYGLAVTDCVFMSSRDGGACWQRSDEAFLRPGPVSERSWVYGDAYLSVGMAPTNTDRAGEAPEISLYSCENHWNGPKTVRRYTLRTDGFVSLHAGGTRTTTETGTLTFAGSRLSLNVSTAAAGSVRVELVDAHGRALEGFSAADCDDIFTDRVDYTVTWRGGDADVSRLSGKPLRLRFYMEDSDLYAFQFLPDAK